jgi:hypothetical protein
VQYDDDLSDVVIPTTPCPPARGTVEEWEAEMASLDHVRGDYDPLAPLVAAAKADFTWGQEEGTNRYGGADAVRRLAQAGASFERIAGYLDCTVEDIAFRFTRIKDEAPKFALAEAALRAFEDGLRHDHFEAIAERTGLSLDQVKHLAQNLGLKTQAAQQLEAGGGRKYGPEVYDLIRKMRVDEGKSFGQIGKRLNMNRNTIGVICGRRGWKPAVRS